MNSSVALIIATYNWPKALEQTLRSVVHQTILPNEVLIADDGSDERTANLIQKFKEAHPTLNIVHVWHEDNGFRLAAIRNKAIRMAQSDYIIQIDGDCFIKTITQKTKELVIIPCNPVIMEIFDKYIDNNNSIVGINLPWQT